MTDQEPDRDEEALAAEREVLRRRRLAAALGDPLPEGSTDDSPEGWGDPDSTARDEEWFRNQVPPHHG